MLQAYEATPEPSVLLASGESEAIRLLAIVLEGFGFVPLECKHEEEALEQLGKNLPCAALVYLGLEAAGPICALVKQREELPLMVLVDADEPDPEERRRIMGARHWEWVDAPVERILEKLRSLLDDSGD